MAAATKGAPSLPGDRQRLAARDRPAGSPVMYQRWRDLLFLHWEFAAGEVQKTLPEGLFVDTFQGRAYIGIVPFFMCGVRPRFFPPIPGISDFLELNLRTYVYNQDGVPGVWFYSLDANQWLAVQIARRLFHLPYEHAQIQATHSAEGMIDYRSRRFGLGASSGSRFKYGAANLLPSAELGSLEFFLVERYRLFAAHRGKLKCGAVHHEPYPLCKAMVPAYDDRLFGQNGFHRPRRPPDHIIMSPGVAVDIYPLRRI